MHPIAVTVADDGRRSRLTVFFRLLLAIPHLVWLALWSLAVSMLMLPLWLITLFARTLPEPLHRFVASYVRYVTHVGAYLYLVANPYPGFTGAAGAYPVDVAIAEPAPQNRWKTGFRIILALPAALLASALANGSLSVGTGGGFSYSGSILILAAVLGWWAAMFTGRVPPGLRHAGAFSLQYSAQLTGYMLLLTDRYPDASPRRAPITDLAEHPVRLAGAESADLRRSRLTVFFRLLLAIPHFVWLALWGIVALPAALANGLTTLVRGRPARPLVRFLSAYFRYGAHVSAFLLLAANPFPGFTGRAGSYPIDLVIEPQERQGRWSVLFRWLLVVPAALLSSAIGSAAYVAAFLGWWAALFTGRMPEQLRDLVAWSLRYGGQMQAYVSMVTGRYPFSGPPA